MYVHIYTHTHIDIDICVYVYIYINGSTHVYAYLIYLQERSCFLSECCFALSLNLCSPMVAHGFQLRSCKSIPSSTSIVLGLLSGKILLSAMRAPGKPPSPKRLKRRFATAMTLCPPSRRHRPRLGQFCCRKALPRRPLLLRSGRGHMRFMRWN